MGELAHIAHVAQKINNKIESYLTNPIKTILLDVNHTSLLEQTKNSPQHDTCGVTAVAAVLEAGLELSPKKCKKINFANLVEKVLRKRSFEFYSIVDWMGI